MSSVLTTPRHAETMDDVYRYQRHIYDVTRKYYLVGRDRLIRQLNVPERGTVLEVGCGTGRNLMQTARQYPHSICYGVDISEQMLRSTAEATDRAGLTHRVFFAQGDGEAFDAKACFSVSGFDRVYLSYCLSMIPDWTKAMNQAAQQVAEGGELHIVDFGQTTRWPGFARKALGLWLSKFHVTPRADLRAAARELASRQGFKMSFTEIGGGYAWLIVLKRRGSE